MLGKKLVAVSCFYGLKFACLHVSRFFIIFLDIKMKTKADMKNTNTNANKYSVKNYLLGKTKKSKQTKTILKAHSHLFSFVKHSM